jgi:uncharacterized protein
VHRTNRLANEPSPYLRQHAHNPVDWYPWGPEALERARLEDKPIFLSIGYSTCHWCHVMERESFEDESIAAQINADFVPVKVDREERPDLDNIYMTAVQAVTGRGGWPMTVVLTPSLQPFYAGTYFPPEDRGGLPGLARLLPALAEAWRERRAEVEESAGSVTRILVETARMTAQAGDAPPGRDALDRACRGLALNFDPEHGGFGRAPKFPTPHQLSFLLRCHARTGDAHALHMAVSTLEHMARGGIHDHLGGGFHRYSTDREWLAPHFEKMLYDQALLAGTFAEAWQATGRADFAATARDICEYVLRDLRDPGGGFHSAEDADSEGEEGRFYVWTRAEVDAALGELAEPLCRAYDVREAGNWEGRNILRLAPGGPGGEAADAPGLARARAKLLEARGRRVRPHRDDKVLAGWNGLMLGALARVGAALDEPRYVEAAAQAAAFLERHMFRDGRLLRRWHGGSADIPAYLEDYAWLSRGLLDLYEATFDARHLARALTLARDMDRLFRDPDGGGYLFSGRDNEKLIAPHKDLYDGALPSGNSVAAGVLLRLGALTGDAALAERGRTLLRDFSATVDENPGAYTEMLQAADFCLGPALEIVVCGPADQPEVTAMWRVVRRTFLPSRVLAFHPGGDAGREIEALIPGIAARAAAGGRPTAYVCVHGACLAPAHTALELQARLQQS